MTIMNLSRRDLDRTHAALRRHTAMAERDQAQKETYMGHLTQSAEIGAGALAAGVMSGRFGNMDLFGVIPSDLLVGLGLHALGFLGVLGKWDSDVHNVGDGVLASYFVKLGVGLGTSWRSNAGLGAFTSGDGYVGAPDQMGQGYGSEWSQGGGLTEQDLAAMAAMA
jgi:hypothetical protein